MYIYGRRPVEEALRREGRVQKVYVLHGSGVEESVRQAARRAHVPCVALDRQRFAQHVRALGVDIRSTQGVLALMAPIPPATLERLVTGAPAGTIGLLVALDGIEDPQNLGAIARCAEAAGAHGIVLPRHHSAPITPAALKASAGALASLPVAVVPNLAFALRTLQEQGWWVVGTAPDGEHLYCEELYDRPIVLVIGNEHRGMRPGIRSLCDIVVRIPLRGRVTSLNAAAATAVVLFEIQRQRYYREQLAVHSTEDPYVSD